MCPHFKVEDPVVRIYLMPAMFSRKIHINIKKK